MKSNALRLAAGLLLAASGVVASAQGLLPSTPKKGFGASITPAYDGWYDNADGTHTFLVGYYNRNWTTEADIPVGPNNYFEPGDPDRGQPTHFLPNRNFGMFSITVPKNFPATQRLWWVITFNGVTQRIGLILSPDYNITPQHASEEAPNGKYNLPPLLRFAPDAKPFQAPVATIATAIQRTAKVGVPMPLDLWVDDDALYASGTNAPFGNRPPPVVTLTVTKYRGPGTVTVDRSIEKIVTLKGGSPMEPFSGKASTTVTFSEAGEYLLHVTTNDYSGKGGGSTGCCWTTALIKVSVRAEAPSTTGH
jgi:hypothetical protein